MVSATATQLSDKTVESRNSGAVVQAASVAADAPDRSNQAKPPDASPTVTPGRSLRLPSYLQPFSEAHSAGKEENAPEASASADALAPVKAAATSASDQLQPEVVSAGRARAIKVPAYLQPFTYSHGYSVGRPTAALVPPGECQFGEDLEEVALLAKVSISHDTRVFTFATPDRTKALGLATCACILASGGQDAEGKAVVRPYTPVSTNEMVGQFELMVKIYENGILSSHLDSMVIGDKLAFKHIPFNVKIQFPFNRRHVGMLVGGTGISPMIQALHAILGSAGDETEVTMLYGSKTVNDILAKETLDAWCESSPRAVARCVPGVSLYVAWQASWCVAGASRVHG